MSIKNTVKMRYQ